MTALKFLALSITAGLAAAPAQVTSTDTEGKGGVDIFFSESYFPAAHLNIHSPDALVLVGITKKLDLLAGPALNVGLLHPGTEHQWAIEYGFQYKFIDRNGWRVLTENAASSPFTNRRAGSHTLFLSASVNRDFSLWGHKIVGYAGYGPTVTVGSREELVFSSKNSAHNFPLGVMVQKGEKWQFFFEFGLRSPVYYSSAVSWNVKSSQ